MGLLRNKGNRLRAGIAVAGVLALALWAGLARVDAAGSTWRAMMRGLQAGLARADAAQRHREDIRRTFSRNGSQAVEGLFHAEVREGLPSRSEGALEVRVKDHRNAIDDFRTLDLSFGALRLAPEPGMKSSDPGWLELAPLLDRMDLTRYKDGAAAATVYRGRLRPRRFAALDLRVAGVRGVLAKTGGAVPVRNAVGPIRLEFEVKPDVTTAVVLDLEVLDLSDHPGRGYELLLKGYELYEDGRLLERIPPG